MIISGLSKIAGSFKNSISINLARFSSQITSNMVKAVVVLAPGAEEVEFVGSVDLLRRAGVSFLIFQYAIFISSIKQLKVEVIVGGLDGNGAVKCSRDVQILPDVALSSIDKDSFDVIVSLLLTPF